MSDISVSVLICTFNRHDMLQRALNAIVNQSTEKPDQIVVVNGGDDKADAVINALRGIHEVNIELVKTNNVNLATSRNIGLRYCTGDIIAMTDDDAQVFPNWISVIKQLHKHYPQAGVIGGQIIGLRSTTSIVSRIADIVTFPQPKDIAYVRTVPGVNASYKREAVMRIGLQDETLFRGEDVDFNWRAIKLGYDVLFHPDMKVVHDHRPTLGKFLHQHYMYGRAYYLVRRKWPEMYSVYPRHIRNLRDFAKLIYFVLSIPADSARLAFKVTPWHSKIIAFPIMLVNGIAWKGGMMVQKYLDGNDV